MKRDPHNGLCRTKGIRHGLGCQDNEGPIDPFIPDHCLERILVALVGCISDDINGIMNVRCRRQVACKIINRFFLEFGKDKVG
jgi:hypothetical protein